MTTPTRFRLTAALAAGAILAGACGGPEASGPSVPGAGDARLRITALVVGTPIDLMVATVTAADIAAPLVFNLPVEAGVATGTLRIPPGQARTILLEAFDALGVVTHEGSATVDVNAGPNPPVSIAMLPRGGDVPVTATLAEFSVLVTPSSASVPAGETLQFAAQILDAGNTPLAGNVVWAVTNPAFARVDAAGLATGVAPGTLSVVATFGGVAGVAQLTVTDGVTGSVQGTVSSPEFGPLAGVLVTVGALSASTGAGGAYSIAGVPEGPVIVSVSGLPAGCADPGPQAAQVVAGQATTVDVSVTCVETGSGTVTGIVRDEFGTPFQGNPVQLGGLSTTTDAEGGFAFTAVPPGTYSLTVGGVPESCQAPAPQEIQVAAGAVITTELVIDCGPPSAIAGLVTWNGLPQAGVVVTASQNGTVVNSTITDAGGGYEMGLDPGTYIVAIGLGCPVNQQTVEVPLFVLLEVNFTCS